MQPSPNKTAATLLLLAAASFAAPPLIHAQGAPSIQRVQVLRGAGQVEIEIEASDRILPHINVLTGPDRLVVDFVNAVPGAQLRSQTVSREEVKGLRVGLFSSNPPVTRVVFDLNGPQPYQIFPSGKTIIVKVGTPGTEAATAVLKPASEAELVSITYPPGEAVSAPIPAPASAPASAKPRLVVSFRDGLLSINTDQASLSEVLFAVHQHTGAEIAIPAGAEQEKVAVHLGPGLAPEVLAHLLNGSKFNFLIMSSASNPRDVDQVILSPRGDGPLSAPSPQLQPMAAEDEQSMQPNAPPPPPPATSENPNAAPDAQAPPAQPSDNPN